jgi:phage-related minor tail protein
LPLHLHRNWANRSNVRRVGKLRRNGRGHLWSNRRAVAEVDIVIDTNGLSERAVVLAVVAVHSVRAIHAAAEEINRIAAAGAADASVLTAKARSAGAAADASGSHPASQSAC